MVERSVLWAGAGATALIAFLCALTALLASQVGCGSTDGSFSIDDFEARPTEFCQLTHFPGFPDSLGSTLLIGLVYLTPVLVVAIGTIVAAARGERDIFWISFAIAGLLVVIAMIISTTMAHVGYQSPV
jgi:hypothetical protein